MKKFIFCRLFETNHGYDYYVAPLHRIGKLIGVIRDDFIEKSSKKILLQCDEKGRVIFGIRQNLPLKDSAGRTRMNFTGYHINSLDELPYFNALSNQFEAIHQEALEAHSILEKNSNVGDKLRDTNIKFPKSSYNPESAWDKSVKELHENPDKPFIKMFDESGKELGIPKEYLKPLIPETKQAEKKIVEEVSEQKIKIAEKKTAFSKKYNSKSETQSTTASIESLEHSTPRLKMIGKMTSIGLILHAGYNYYLAFTHTDKQTNQRQFDMKRGALATAETLAAVGLGFMSRGR